MKPTDVLVDEHRLIKRMLAVLDRACRALERGSQVDMALFDDALDFIRNYADRLHHGKEEDQLFPLMEERGGETGLIGVMLEDHVQGRTYVKNMAAAVEAYRGGDPSAAAALIANAAGYCDLLHGHIEREDFSLFPSAEELFESADRRALQAQFEQVDQAVMGAGGHQRYLDMVERLERLLA